MAHSSPTQRSYGDRHQAEYGNEGGYAAYEDGERGHTEYGGESGYPGYEGEGGHVGYEAEKGHTEYNAGYGYYPHDYRPQQYAGGPYDDPPAHSAYSGHTSRGYEDSKVAGNGAGSMADYGNRSSLFHTKNYAALHDSDSERRKKDQGCLDRVCCCRAKWAQWCGLLCCLIILAIIAFAAVLAATFKKPTVEFTGVGNYPDPKVQKFDIKDGSFDINVGLNITIDNPNIIGASFPRIKAKATYPNSNNTEVGGGELDNVDIPSKSVTNITFPFSINYDTTKDPTLKIVYDLLRKCKRKQQITVDYNLVVSVKIIVVTISLPFDRTANIDCPFDESNMPKINGVDINNLKARKRALPENLH